MDEDDIVDPKPSIDAKCLAQTECAKALVRTQDLSARCVPCIPSVCSAARARGQVEYERCSARIEAKGSGQCSGQYMDYIKCVDLCAVPKLFGALK